MCGGEGLHLLALILPCVVVWLWWEGEGSPWQAATRGTVQAEVHHTLPPCTPSASVWGPSSLGTLACTVVACTPCSVVLLLPVAVVRLQQLHYTTQAYMGHGRPFLLPRHALGCHH